MSERFVSVIVPTRNRAQLLRGCLLSLLALDYPRDRYEIVVVDNGSIDDTKAVVESFQGRQTTVICVHESRRGLNAARNAGLACARGHLMCFVDDDIVAPQGWLRAMVEGWRRWPDAGCYGGPVRLRLEGGSPRVCGREPLDDQLDLGGEERPLHLSPGFRGALIAGANMALASAALQIMGPFDERLSGWGDETEWEERHLAAGGRVIYLPDAWVWHRRTADDLKFLHLARKRFRRGQEQVMYSRFCRKPISLGATLSAIPRALTHAIVRRCAWGILAAAEHVGCICEIVGGGTLRHNRHPEAKPVVVQAGCFGVRSNKDREQD